MTRDHPSRWLTDNADLYPPVVPVVPDEDPPRALDVACGRGRHARWLARAGYRVDAVDRDAGTLAALRRQVDVAGESVTTRLLDLEQPGVTLGAAVYDLVVVFRYLHRPLFPAIREALRPGGVLVYETFTTAQARHGRPTNPAFLLKPGELLRLVAPMTVLRQHGCDDADAVLAGVVARR